MQNVIMLREIELVPVLEIESFQFKTQDRPHPSGSRAELGNAWHRYWLDALADSGVIGLDPIYPGSQHVSTASLVASPMLENILRVLLRDGGGVETLSDPETIPVLNGGLALRGLNTTVLIQPTCCSDLRDVAGWRNAVRCGGDWQMLWIGHPWVSVRSEGSHLLLSQPHESNDPVARWAVTPAELEHAVTVAERGLETFAGSVSAALISLGYAGEAELMGRRLAGSDSPIPERRGVIE